MWDGAEHAGLSFLHQYAQPPPPPPPPTLPEGFKHAYYLCNAGTAPFRHDPSSYGAFEGYVAEMRSERVLAVHFQDLTSHEEFIVVSYHGRNNKINGEMRIKCVRAGASNLLVGRGRGTVMMVLVRMQAAAAQRLPC